MLPWFNLSQLKLMANATSALLASYGSFNPMSLGLRQWYDFNDVTQAYDSTVGGSLVVADGANFKRINDKSGNAFHLTEAGGPVVRTTGMNGKRCADFQGNSYLASTLDPLFNRNNSLIAMVIQEVAYKANQGYIVFGASGAGSDTGLTGANVEQGGSGATNIVAAMQSGTVAATGIPALGNAMSVIINMSNATALTIYINGVLNASAAIANGWNNTIAGFGVANRYLSGAWNASTYRANIKMGELFISNAKTATEIADIHNLYFKPKFGLP